MPLISADDIKEFRLTLGDSVATDDELRAALSAAHMDLSVPKGKSVQHGPRGGDYYVDDAGAKVYVDDTSTTATRAASEEKPTASPVNSLKPTNRRAFLGKPVNTPKISKQAAGKIGEAIILSFLKQKGFADARPMNSKQNNFPIDLIQDHEVIEVKTGQASNGSGAQKWRLTIGEPGKAEKEWLAQASAEDKAAWNLRKQADIHKRKQAILDQIAKETGKKVKAATMTVIVDPQTKTADVYRFDGFHNLIGWRSPLAQGGYIGSFKYA